MVVSHLEGLNSSFLCLCRPVQDISPLLDPEVLESRTYNCERCGSKGRKPGREYKSTPQKGRDI